MLKWRTKNLKVGQSYVVEQNHQSNLLELFLDACRESSQSSSNKVLYYVLWKIPRNSTINLLLYFILFDVIFGINMHNALQVLHECFHKRRSVKCFCTINFRMLWVLYSELHIWDCKVLQVLSLHLGSNCKISVFYLVEIIWG